MSEELPVALTCRSYAAPVACSLLSVITIVLMIVDVLEWHSVPFGIVAFLVWLECTVVLFQWRT
jgi:hypothetical protein